MKTLFKEVPIYKQVPDGFKQVPFYATDDGKEFTDKLDAQNHEDKVFKRKNFAEKYHLCDIQLSSGEQRCWDAMFVKEINETVKNELTKYFGRSFPFRKLMIGWNLIHVDDSGDYVSIDCCDIKGFISELETEIEDKKNDINTLKTLEDKT